MTLDHQDVQPIDVTYPGPQQDIYEYDPVGNRKSLNGANYTYDDADEILTVGGVTYAYGSNGNQVRRGGDLFRYDHEDRLTKVVLDCYDFNFNGLVDINDVFQVSGRFNASVGDSNYDRLYDFNGDGTIGIDDIFAVNAQFNRICPGTPFTYNGDGLRATKDAGSLVTSYVWDVAAGLPVVLQDGDKTYVYGLDLISATDGGGVQTYHLYDGLGSTTDLTDGSGNVTAGYSYDVFGALRSQTGTGDTDFRFTGEQLDADSDFYYLRARYYDPEIGRFLGQDPFGGFTISPQSQNRYPYSVNDPVNLVDPWGLCGVRSFGDFADCRNNVRGGLGTGLDSIERALFSKEGGFNIPWQIWESAEDTWSLLSRFATRECLGFAIGVGGLIGATLVGGPAGVAIILLAGSASATLEFQRGNETFALFEGTRAGVDEGFYFLAELAKAGGGSAQRIVLFRSVAGVVGLLPSGILCFGSV